MPPAIPTNIEVSPGTLLQGKSSARGHHTPRWLRRPGNPPIPWSIRRRSHDLYDRLRRRPFHQSGLVPTQVERDDTCPDTRRWHGIVTLRGIVLKGCIDRDESGPNDAVGRFGLTRQDFFKPTISVQSSGEVVGRTWRHGASLSQSPRGQLPAVESGHVRALNRAPVPKCGGCARLVCYRDPLWCASRLHAPAG